MMSTLSYWLCFFGLMLFFIGVNIEIGKIKDSIKQKISIEKGYHIEVSRLVGTSYENSSEEVKVLTIMKDKDK